MISPHQTQEHEGQNSSVQHWAGSLNWSFSHWPGTVCLYNR